MVILISLTCPSAEGWVATPARPGLNTFFCPLSQVELYRKALAAGCKTMKVTNYMAIGPFDPPD